jgi:sucrose-6-phosphate hydrolase SacC (GH32 family)
VRLLVGGGDDPANLYVALVRAADGAVLFRATGTGAESYRNVSWDASAYRGQELYVRAVDTATGGWGHINVDDVRVYQAAGDAGVVAHWPFDEGSGTVAHDAAGGIADPVRYVFNDRHFKPRSDPLWRSGTAGHGVLAKALLFDGYSTWVTRQPEQAPALTDALTIEAWVAPRAFEWGDERKLSAIVDRHDEGARQGYILGVGRHGAWSFQAGIGGTWQAVWADPGAALRTGRWHHVVATFSVAERMMRLYLDGRPVGGRSTPAGPIATWPGSLLIGRHNHPVVINGTFTVNMFSGLIDEVRLRDRALTAEQVRGAYDAARATFAAGIVPTPDLAMNRSRFAGDRYRPTYHFMAPEHWMNEPHAPLYFDGQYHLFYQHNQHGPYWHNIGWGHAVSPDMVHWRDLPMALVPTAGSVAPDGVWSGGSTVDGSGKPVLVITAGDDGVFPNQRTGLARSASSPTDRDLTKWVMDPHPVTVQDPNLDVGAGRRVRYGDFRDPFVWREGDTWYQLVGSGVRTTSGADVGGTALLYTSTDLVRWSYAGPLLVGDLATYPKTGQVWELPVFLPITDARGRRKHVLLVNPAWSGPTPHNVKYVWYWVGSWNPATRSFTPDTREPRLFDYGEHFTGPSGLVDHRGRSVVFSIAQDKRTERAHYDAGWAHNAGLPVMLSLRPDGDLGVAPLPELASLHRGDPLASVGDADIAAANRALAGARGDSLHLTLEISPRPAGRVGVKVLRSANGEEETVIFYDAATQTFGVDRRRSGTVSSLFGDLGVQAGPLPLGDAALQLDVFVDKSMVEVYANGHRSITTRAYPGRDDALGLQVFGDEPATVRSLRVWQMGPAF